MNGTPSPTAEEQRILLDRAARLARPAAADAVAETTLELVVFSIAGGRYGLETRYVREVARLRELTPVPGVADFMIGVTSIRGEFLALVDLRHFLGLSVQGLSDLSYIVVCGIDRTEFGILTDAVHELLVLPASEIVAAPMAAAGSASDHLRGVTRDALAVLDGARLLEDERLFVRQQ